MGRITINKERYTAIQVVILVTSFIVYVYLNRRELTEFEGWVELFIYIGFNLSIMLSGQKLGSYKETMIKMHSILDSDAADDIRLNEALRVLEMSALTTGLIFEKYNKTLPRRIKKQKKRLEKERAKMKAEIPK